MNIFDDDEVKRIGPVSDVKKLAIEFKDGIRKVIENVEGFDFGDRTFLRVSIKGRSYYMFVAYDCVKCMEVIE